MPSVKREPMQLTEEELLVESDEDLEIGASLSVGLDDRNRMVVQLEYVYYDDHPVLPPPSYVKGQFKEVLDFLIDCGARYRLYET